MENAQNFVLSLALLSVHQKTFMHPARDADCQFLDFRRALFRKKVIGKRVRGGRRRPKGDADSVETSSAGGLSKAHPRRAQSISSAGNRRAADTSLLSYFHIRNSTEDSIEAVEEEGEERSTTASTLVHGPSMSILAPPDLASMPSGTHTYSDAQSQSPLSPSPSPSLSHVAFYPSLSSSSAPSSPLLALPTQHQVRIHDPRLLCTLDMVSTISTLAEQYHTTIQELMEPDRGWLEQGRREERARERREQVELDEYLTLRSQQSLGSSGASPADDESAPTLTMAMFAHRSSTSESSSDPRARRGSFTVGEREVSVTPARPSLLQRGRARLASAEDASKRSTLTGKEGSPTFLTTTISTSSNPSSLADPRRNGTLPSQTRGHHREHSGSLVSQTRTVGTLLDADHDDPLAAIESTAPPTATLPIGEGAVAVSSALSFHCDCDVLDAETKAEAQEFVCVEIINPQFNCHSEETRGRLLFMTSQITLYGRIDWIHSVHQPHDHADSPYVIRTNSFSAPDSPDHHRRGSTSPPLPIISRDKFRLSVVLDDIQAFVAPTDIDVDAGVIWMNKQNVGVLKSIMKPATFQVNAQVRPEMMPISTIRVAERRTPPDTDNKDKDSSRARKDRKEHEEKMMEAAALRRDASLNLLPAVLTAGAHHLVFPHADFNRVDVQLPEMTFNLDAYQFSLLVDVLKTVGAPLPMQSAKKEEEQAVQAEDVSIEDLKLHAVRLQQRMIDVVWELKAIGWLTTVGDEAKPVDAAEEWDEEHERQVQQHLNASTSSSLGTFEYWLVETAHRIEKDREQRDDGLRKGSTELHQRFQALLAEQSRVGLEFFNVLLAVRGKERQLSAVKVHHLQLGVMVERVNYLMIKNEKPFMNLYLDQLTLSATAAVDATLDVVVDVKGIGGRILLPHYLDPTKPEYEWKELVQLFMGTGKGIDSAWAHKDAMLHVQLVVKADSEGVVVKHLEVNLHPVSRCASPTRA